MDLGTYIGITGVYVAWMIVSALLFRRKTTRLQRELFNLRYESLNQQNEMENVLVLIAEGELLKREMVVMAQKVLDECEGE